MTNHSLLIVDDDPATIRVLGKMLKALGETRFATNGSDALRIARESKPELVLLDAEMPGMSGLEVCKAIKSDPLLEDVAVIFVTSHGDEASEVAALDAGAADFITKPPRAPLVVARVRTQLRLKDAISALRRAASVDSLTEVANRRRFDELLLEEWQRAERGGTALSLLMLDVDWFKRFNDLYGHVAGDDCLRAVARALTEACRRPADLVARYGGEEFALLMPETDERGAKHVATRALDAVRALQIAHDASPVAPYVTVSIGVTTLPAQRCSHRSQVVPRISLPLRPRATVQLVDAADRALYAAKQSGRDRACVERFTADPEEDCASSALDAGGRRGEPPHVG